MQYLLPHRAVHLWNRLNSTPALGRAQAQVGDPQDFDFWNKMRQHNLVLWLDYTEEATSYHTLDMSIWGAVKYRRTFSADYCNGAYCGH